MHKGLNFDELKSFLDEKAEFYNRAFFIDTDPIQVPHLFNKKEDIEIAGFLSALIAWGQRKIIIKNAKSLVERMDHSPYEFILSHSENDLNNFNGFVHRTINDSDIKTILKGLQHIYINHGGLEALFDKYQDRDSLQNGITELKKKMFEIPHENRSTKHLSDPSKGSAAKRINMFLRWMIRQDNHRVDFGVWKSIPPSKLSCPLDVHTANVGRKLGIIQRNQNDQKTLLELDSKLREFDPIDPVKYDYALFGLGAFEKF